MIIISEDNDILNFIKRDVGIDNARLRFQPIVSLVRSPTFVVYLCSAKGIASVYEPAGPEFEYSGDFCFYKQ